MSTVIAAGPRSKPIAIAVTPGRSSVLAVRGQAGRGVIAAGLRGPGGATGLSAVQLPINFSFGDASPRAAFTLPADAFLSELQLSIELPFDGESPALLVRTGTGLVLMAADQNAPGFAATYETTPAAQLLAGTQIIIETTPGAGATAGAGKLLLNLH